jgi:hypothetical protein
MSGSDRNVDPDKAPELPIRLNPDVINTQLPGLDQTVVYHQHYYLPEKGLWPRVLPEAIAGVIAAIVFAGLTTAWVAFMPPDARGTQIAKPASCLAPQQELAKEN